MNLKSLKMNRKQFAPGSWYVDAAVDGKYVCLITDNAQRALYFDTHVGRVELPNNEGLLQIRLDYNYPTLRFAGHGWESGNAWEYKDKQWYDHGPAFGVNSCIFRPDGTLEVVTRDEWNLTGSQGWRYVDDNGNLVPGDKTYADIGRGIFEYTETGGVTIGQSDYIEGAHAILSNGKRVIIEQGQIKFIRVHRVRDQFAISFVQEKPRPGYAVIIWCSLEELENFPEAVLPDKPDEPEEPEEPKEPEKPKEDNVMMMPQNVYDTIVKVVERYPHKGSDDERREAMKKVVATLRKRHGNNWVWKSEHSNLSSPSKDGLGFVPKSPEHGQKMSMYIWDLINGTTREPNPRGDSEELREAYVILVDPFDHLSSDSSNDKNDDMDDKNENEEFSAQLSKMHNEILALRQELDSIKKTALKNGDVISIQANSGKFLCEDKNRDAIDIAGNVGYEPVFNRESAFDWEEFKIFKK